MEGSRALFGRGLGRDLGPLGSFWGLFFSHLYLEWSSKVLLEAPRLDFGSILGCLGRILGGFGECFWRGTHFEFARRILPLCWLIFRIFSFLWRIFSIF